MIPSTTSGLCSQSSPSPGGKIAAPLFLRQSDWHRPGAECNWTASEWTCPASHLSPSSIPRTDAIGWSSLFTSPSSSSYRHSRLFQIHRSLFSRNASSLELSLWYKKKRKTVVLSFPRNLFIEEQFPSNLFLKEQLRSDSLWQLPVSILRLSPNHSRLLAAAPRTLNELWVQLSVPFSVRLCMQDSRL